MNRVFPDIIERSISDTSQVMRQKKEYVPKLCKVYSWENIEYTFENYFGGKCADNIALIVKHIKDSDLSNRLFGLTSMDKLVIGIYNPIEWDRETLHITYDSDQNQLEFIYFPMPFRKPKFVRKYPKEKGVEKFNNFIKMIGW